MPRLYGGEVTMTSTLWAGSCLNTSRQSARWNCALVFASISTMVWGFRRTGTPLFRREMTSTLVGRRECGDEATRLWLNGHRARQDALRVRVVRPTGAETASRSATVWLRRCP